MRMVCQFLLASSMMLAGSALHAQQILGYTPVTTKHLSRRNLRQLEKRAATPEQYEFLSRYFRDRSQELRDEAWQINTIVLQRQIVGANAGSKYWQSVESGSNLHRYYTAEAREMETQAEEFDARAHEVAGVSAGPEANPATNPAGTNTAAANQTPAN